MRRKCEHSIRYLLNRCVCHTDLMMVGWCRNKNLALCGGGGQMLIAIAIAVYSICKRVRHLAITCNEEN